MVIKTEKLFFPCSQIVMTDKINISPEAQKMADDTRATYEAFPPEMLEKDINMKNDEGETVLHFVAKRGNFALFKFFVVRGADPFAITDHGDTILHSAARGGNLDIVKFIVEALEISPS